MTVEVRLCEIIHGSPHESESAVPDPAAAASAPAATSLPIPGLSIYTGRSRYSKTQMAEASVGGRGLRG
jgi:hypothetical protein